MLSSRNPSPTISGVVSTSPAISPHTPVQIPARSDASATIRISRMIPG